MTDPICAALERLLARLDETTDPDGPVPAWSDSYLAARAALAQHEPKGEINWAAHFIRRAVAQENELKTALAQPEPPAEGEVGELVAELRHFLAGYQQMRGLDPEHIYSIHRGDAMEAHIRVSRLTRAADLLEQRHPAPVPVPETKRRPFSRECDEDGYLWLGVLQDDPLLEGPHFSFWSYEESRKLGGTYTHFLPYNTPCLPAHAQPLPTTEATNG